MQFKYVHLNKTKSVLCKNITKFKQLHNWNLLVHNFNKWYEIT